MKQQMSYSAIKNTFWYRLPTGLLIYWLVCLLVFRIAGAFDFSHFWPHYYSAKNGSSFFSIAGLTTLIAFMLFGIATIVASMQMLAEKDENAFRKLSKWLRILMILTAVILPMLGQAMVKADKAKDIEALLQLANSLKIESPEIRLLIINYYTDFKGKTGDQAEIIIKDAKKALNNKIFG